jgi:hypothetical protein
MFIFSDQRHHLKKKEFGSGEMKKRGSRGAEGDEGTELITNA